MTLAMSRCNAKRVSKKYESSGYNGKQLYGKSPKSTLGEIRSTMVTLERLETRFLRSISALESSIDTTGEHKQLRSPQTTRAFAPSLAPSVSSPSSRNVLLESLAKPDLSNLDMGLLQGPSQRAAAEDQPSMSWARSSLASNVASLASNPVLPVNGSFLQPGLSESLLPSFRLTGAGPISPRVTAPNPFAMRSPSLEQALLPNLTRNSSGFSRTANAGGFNQRALSSLGASQLDRARLQMLQASLQLQDTSIASGTETALMAANLQLQRRAATTNALLQRNRLAMLPVAGVDSSRPPADSNLKRSREDDEREDTQPGKQGRYGS